MAGTVLNIQKDSSSVLLAGNFFDSNIEMGKYDASYGDVLSINKRKEMNVRPPGSIRLTGQIKHILPIVISGKVHYVIARNNDSALILGAKEKTRFFTE